MQGLTEGRIVHYVAYNGRHFAGMVIGIYSQESEDTRADLVVFTNMENVNGVKNFGIQFHHSVEYADLPKPGTWHWPERN